mmetsp:Transcript_17594/g.37994  ORF Transcript_17594/g.37994 Transcript_17594/m.37994 type:complete len:242 (+) Transcript_17594:63-788(+)
MDVDVAGPGPSSSQARARGRLQNQLRTVTCERGSLNRADGSAKWAQENSVVLAAVYGPRQAQAKKEDAEKAVVEVVFKPRSGLQAHRDRDYEHIIRRTLEGVIPLGTHPRTSIMVALQVLQEDGSMLSCAINAACAALVDAGVPLTTMFGSVSCALGEGGALLLDPDAGEEQAALAVVSLAFPYHFDLTAGGKGMRVVQEEVLASHTWGCCSLDQYLDVMTVAKLACGQLADFSRVVLTKA